MQQCVAVYTFGQMPSHYCRSACRQRPMLRCGCVSGCCCCQCVHGTVHLHAWQVGSMCPIAAVCTGHMVTSIIEARWTSLRTGGRQPPGDMPLASAALAAATHHQVPCRKPLSRLRPSFHDPGCPTTIGKSAGKLMPVSMSVRGQLQSGECGSCLRQDTNLRQTFLPRM